MAQKVQVLLVDDLDGSEATETVAFGLDGAAYEIDLSSGNAGKLRKELAHYVEHARKASAPARRRRARTGPGRGPSSAATRSMSAAAFRRTSSRSTKPRTSPRAPEFAGGLGVLLVLRPMASDLTGGSGGTGQGLDKHRWPGLAATSRRPGQRCFCPPATPRRARGGAFACGVPGVITGTRFCFTRLMRMNGRVQGTSWVCVTHTWEARWWARGYYAE